jgi:serine/threonine protein kinase
VFLHQTKRGEIVKIVDFGIAKITADINKEIADITETGAVIGTSNYMSPEQLMGEPCDGRSDVYSVGVMLYQMLVGQLPFKDDKQMGSLGTTLKRLIENPIPIGNVDSSIPLKVQSLIEKALSREPDERPTARQLANELTNLHNGLR